MTDNDKDSQKTERKETTHNENPMEMIKTPKIPVRSEFSLNKEKRNNK